MPIQQMLLGTGAVATKTYIDDVFSTFLYTGNDSTQVINNGIDLSGEGGLVWLKCRNQSTQTHYLMDSARNSFGNRISSDGTAAETTDALITATSSTGFTLGNKSYSNGSGDNYTSWTFRKAPGFFDVVTYTGSGNVQSISHSLGSVPGMVIIKRTGASADWYVWHRYNSEKYLKLNSTASAATNSGNQYFGTTFNSTHFSVGHDSNVNASGGSYVAYVFAGGESPNANSRSTAFVSSVPNYVSIPDNDDFDLGTGDFTIECFVKVADVSATAGTIFTLGNESNNSSIGINLDNSQSTHVYADTGAKCIFPDNTLGKNQWKHLAVTKSSNVIRYFVDGQSASTTYTQTNSIGGGSNGYLTIGASDEDGTKRSYFNGRISDFRIIKGTALYTSSFKAPTAALTNVTNTVLLCLNGSGSTDSTVTPATITSSGYIVTYADGPFDDPSNFVFGKNEDQNIIKCGEYKTFSNEDAHVYLGWEPQFVLAKRIDSNSGGPDWMIIDSMRGLPNAQDVEGNASGQCKVLEANTSDSEINTSRIGITPTGFYADQFGSNRSYIYMAIRRPDGYVGKPPELGTDVFNMVAGTSNSDIPVFVSGFPVDYALFRPIASTSDFIASARVTQGRTLDLNNNYAEIASGNAEFDLSNGWGSWTADLSSYQSWMWKRHAGFDVVTYEGNGTAGHQIPHSLNKIPQMIWAKARNTGSSTEHWGVYHEGISGSGKSIFLNLSNAATGSMWNATTPTSTYFELSNDFRTNGTYNYIAMLFASVNGISKVGSYDGTDASSLTITTGFQPRFIIVKRTDATAQWFTFDTTRGWTSNLLASSDDKALMLNADDAQWNNAFGHPISTGFTLNGAGYGNGGGSGSKYIYYAHA